MNLYGGGTQSASNIDHSDSADLFNLDVQRTGNDESRYANSQEKTRSYLHRVSTTEIPGDAEPAEQNDHDNKSVPGCLPGHHVVDGPSMVTWGIRRDDEILYPGERRYFWCRMENLEEDLLIKLHCILMTGIAAPTTNTYH